MADWLAAAVRKLREEVLKKYTKYDTRGLEHQVFVLFLERGRNVC